MVPTNATQGELRLVCAPTGTAGANDYLDVDEVQLEIGGIATAFDRRPFLDELAPVQAVLPEDLFPTGRRQRSLGLLAKS